MSWQQELEMELNALRAEKGKLDRSFYKGGGGCYKARNLREALKQKLAELEPLCHGARPVGT